ncbi:BQ2448_1596 [Microbotryum intermedium]|uniref:BQ2448_1596 protein n=1 Tax=Microbotryum intermedium TaxID=269621 RepID=A0A238F8K5_9BASI|nr:BQ2448_1596 [Microbotryum intermedium]
MLGYASSAGAFAFSTASSYVFRPDASTSSLPDRKSPASSSPSSASSSISASNSSGANNHATTNGRSHGNRHHVNATTDALAPSKRVHTNKDPTRQRRPTSQLPSAHLHNATNASASTSTGTSTARATTANGANHADQTDKREGQDLVDRINLEDDLYRILGVARKSKTEEIRRAFLSKSRLCHPDKLPDYEPATPAFQRLSYAYETLSKPTSRRMYDLGGGKPLDHGPPRGDAESGMGSDETLNGVLRNVFTEVSSNYIPILYFYYNLTFSNIRTQFLAGDFEMIRVFVNALNDGNPGLNLGEEAVDNLEGAFRKVREVLLSGQKYMRIVKFELIRLYEIQHSLRSLGYFDLVGRFRLTLALTRVTLEIPMVLDRAMRDEVPNVPYGLGPAGKERETKGGNREANGEEGGGSRKNGEQSGASAAAGGELQRRGLLGPRVKGVLVVACKMLEKAEKFGT